MSEFLSTKEVGKLFELAKKPYRPKEIIELGEKIERETKVAELKASVGVIDQEHIQKIVKMKLQLDGLYCDWVEKETL